MGLYPHLSSVALAKLALHTCSWECFTELSFTSFLQLTAIFILHQIASCIKKAVPKQLCSMHAKNN